MCFIIALYQPTIIHVSIYEFQILSYNTVIFLFMLVSRGLRKRSDLHGRRMRVVSVRLELNGVPADLRAGGEPLRVGSVRHSLGVSIGDNW